jgi:hypothetical protein
LDHIMTFSISKGEHVQRITDVTYITQLVCSGGISMYCKKIKTIHERPEPKNVKHLQSFVGFANFYYCHLIHKLS